jgi:hypothetical protein
MIKMAKPIAWRVNTVESWTPHHTLDDVKQAAGVTDQGAQEGWRWPDGPIQPLYTIDDAMSYDTIARKYRISGIRNSEHFPHVYRFLEIEDVTRAAQPIFQIDPR